MASHTLDLSAVGSNSPCSHRATTSYIEVTRNKSNKMLRRYSCGPCQRGWWECNSVVVDVSDACRMITEANEPGQRRTPLRAGAS